MVEGTVMSNDDLFIVILIAIAIPIAIGFWRAKSECPKCRRKLAMKRTGQSEERGLSEIPHYEVQCKYCGHREWRKAEPSGGYYGE